MQLTYIAHENKAYKAFVELCAHGFVLFPKLDSCSLLFPCLLYNRIEHS